MSDLITIVEKVIHSTYSMPTDLNYDKFDLQLIDPSRMIEPYSTISISEVEEILVELTEKGCDKVQITFNSDHYEYQFVGTNTHSEVPDKLKLEHELDQLSVMHESYVENTERMKKTVEHNIQQIQDMESKISELQEKLKAYE